MPNLPTGSDVTQLMPRPPQPAPPINPLADVAQILQLRQTQALLPLRIQEAQQQAQENALRLQETQRQITDRDNMRRSYSASMVTDPNTGAPTTDRNKLVQAMKDNNLADQIPAALEGLDKIDKGHADLIEQQNKIKTANLDYAAGLGTALKANNYNPDFYRQQIQTSVANKDTTAQNAQQILSQLDQLDQQDPTGNLARQFTKQHADTMIAQGSPQFQTAQGALQRGASAQEQADTAKGREAREGAAQGYTQAVGALATNPPKDAAGYQQFIDGLPHGVATRILQTVPAEKYDPATSPALLNKSAMTPEERFKADNPTQAGGDDFEKFFTQWRKDNKAPDSSAARLMAKKAWAAASQAPERPPQAPVVMVPGPNGTMIPTQSRIGVPLAAGAMTTAGMNAVNTPTAATRTMAETAPKVIELADRVSQLVDQQEKSLGPAASRWNEFMAGKVGAPNPGFTQLRTDVGLLQTALMRMHVGARGGGEIMQHFTDLINSSKQSPENMRAALGEIKAYAQAVAGSGKPPAASGAGNAAPSVPDAVKTLLGAKNVAPGVHKLSDGTSWMKTADGTITKQ